MVQDNGYQAEYVPSAVHLSDGTRSELDYQEPNFDAEIVGHEGLTERWPLFLVSPPGEADWVLKKDRDNMTEAIGTSDNLVASMGSLGLSQTGTRHSHKKPLGWKSHTAAVVKFYQDPQLLLNDVVEVVGVLDRDSLKEDQLPIVHAILYRHLVSYSQHSQQAVQWHGRGLEQPTMHVLNHSWSEQECTQLRTELLGWLKQLFGQDELVAEYVLLWLISRIYNRRPDINVGHISLKFLKTPDAQAEHLERALSQLVDRLVHLPLRLDILNGNQFRPTLSSDSADFNAELDYAKGHLSSGVLQLAKHSYLVVDETALSNGQLEQRGIENLRALAEAIASYRLEYPRVSDDEKYVPSGVTAEMDLNVIVLSSSTHSASPASSGQGAQTQVGLGELLETTLELIWPENADISSAPAPADIESYRKYILLARQGKPSLDYEIPEAVSSRIIQDFVEMRKKEGSKVSDQSLMRILDLARLHCVSHFRSNLTWSDWERARHLEERRLELL